MSVHERSLGPFYFATTRTSVMTVPPAIVGLVQQAKPYRRGKGLMFFGRLYQGVIIGLWFKPWKAKDGGVDQWFGPYWMDVDVDEIATWSNGAEDEEIEEAGSAER